MLVVNDSGANQVVATYGSGEGRLATNPIAIGIPRPAPLDVSIPDHRYEEAA